MTVITPISTNTLNIAQLRARSTPRRIRMRAMTEFVLLRESQPLTYKQLRDEIEPLLGSGDRYTRYGVKGEASRRSFFERDLSFALQALNREGVLEVTNRPGRVGNRDSKLYSHRLRRV